MNKAQYKEYLLTPTWKATRRAAIEHHGNLCHCGSVAYEVHHLTYENLGNEKMEDLIPLCGYCHSAYHRVDNLRKKAEKLSGPPEIPDAQTTEARKKQVLADYHTAFPTNSAEVK